MGQDSQLSQDDNCMGQDFQLSQDLHGRGQDSQISQDINRHRTGLSTVAGCKSQEKVSSTITGC